MKAVIQTVLDASVKVDGNTVGAIDRGMLVYFGVQKDDTVEMVAPFLDKMLKMRIFKDSEGKTNLDLVSSGGSILFISQFTLAANVYRGNRPSFDAAAPGEVAREFYEKGIQYLREKGLQVQTGMFGAHMLVSYVNDGPETFILESDRFLDRK